MRVKEYYETISDIYQLVKQKLPDNLSEVLNKRYSLPYLSWLTDPQLLDFKEWLEKL